MVFDCSCRFQRLCDLTSERFVLLSERFYRITTRTRLGLQAWDAFLLLCLDPFVDAFLA